LYVECGASVTRAAAVAGQSGLAGLEFAFGIPGTCGGAVYMNAGAYDNEMSDIVAQSTYYMPSIKAIYTLEGEQHNFSYRKSFYTDSSNIILSAVFQLQYGDKHEIKEKMEDYKRRRIDKQPLEYPSAGSVFKRYPGYFTSRLIEEAGLKGITIGGAQVSPKHAGFIVNKGDATAADVLRLIEVIKNEVYKRNNINIECEMKYIE
jgi:UDP-N-acetylmuramate dehydrogenase